MVLVTQGYYGQGDMLYYYHAGVMVSRWLSIDLWGNLPQVLSLLLHGQPNLPLPIIGVGRSTGTMAAISGLMLLPLGNSIYSACLAVGIVSFFAKRRLYLEVRRVLDPRLFVRVAAGMLLLPTAVFWSCGIVKESVAIIGLSLLVVGVCACGRRKFARGAAGVATGAVLVGIVKAYVLVAFVVALGVWVYRRRAVATGRQLSVPSALVAAAVAVGGGLYSIGIAFPRYAVDNVMDATAHLQSVGTQVQGGSSYSIVGSYSAKDEILATPYALITSLFRPFPWEIRNPLIFLNAAEATGLAALVFVAARRLGMRAIWHAIVSSPPLAFGVTFTLNSERRRGSRDDEPRLPVSLPRSHDAVLRRVRSDSVGATENGESLQHGIGSRKGEGLAMRPTRVLHVITGLNAGGAEAMLHALLGAFAQRAMPIQSHVVVLRGGGVLAEPIRDLGVPVYQLLSGGGCAGEGPAKVLRRVRRFRPDVVHGWMYHGNLGATLLTSMFARGARTVWGIHACLDDPWALGPSSLGALVMNRIGSGRADSIVYCAEAARRMHERIGFAGRNGEVISNGFDCARFRPSIEARRSVREELGVGSSAVLVGCFARYHPMKDHGSLFRAARIVCAKRPETVFVLVGSGVDRSNAIVRAQLHDLGLHDKMVLLGERRDVARLMAGQDLTVLPSYSEAFPMVVGESMACGVPCVATDVGDAALLLGDTGMLVPAQSHEALAHAIVRIIDLDDPGRAALGRQARSRVQERFSIEETATRYANLYRSDAGHAFSMEREVAVGH